MNDIEKILTKREREVIELVSQGLTNPQIGKRLYISKDCARFHVNNILTKLDAISRTHAAVKWVTRKCRCKPVSLSV